MPLAFTENGIAMLSSVLNSERAIRVNIAIMRTFTKLREVFSAHKELAHKLHELENKVGRHDEAINVFEKVIEIDSRHGLAHAILGGYYRKNEFEELAQVHIEAARELIADNENEYNRACMESICGNADQSLVLLEIALKNKHSYVNLARKDPDLDFIRSDPRFHALLDKYAVKSA